MTYIQMQCPVCEKVKTLPATAASYDTYRRSWRVTCPDCQHEATAYLDYEQFVALSESGAKNVTPPLEVIEIEQMQDLPRITVDQVIQFAQSLRLYDLDAEWRAWASESEGLPHMALCLNCNYVRLPGTRFAVDMTRLTYDFICSCGRINTMPSKRETLKFLLSIGAADITAPPEIAEWSTKDPRPIDYDEVIDMLAGLDEWLNETCRPTGPSLGNGLLAT